MLYKLAQEEKKAYFVYEDSGFDLSTALSLYKPKIVFIDDAHKNPGLITKIRSIRENLEISFRIISTCWPNEQKEIIREQGIYSTETTIELKAFTRDELGELLKELLGSLKLERIYWLEQNIIDQSNGFPGLAVGLFNICRQHGAQDVINGKAILQHLTNIALEVFGELEWQKTKRILAYCSIGGSKGMTPEDLSRVTTLNKFELTTQLRTFQYGGIIFEKAGRYIVRPQILRSVLVKEEFFSNSNIDQVESIFPYIFPLELINVLLDVADIGGLIPDKILIDLLSKHGFYNNLWERYYKIFPEKIQETLTKFPETLSACTYPALKHDPEFILPFLLQQASNDNRPLNSNPDHVLRKIQNWLNFDHKTEETIIKREYLFDAVKKFFENGGNQKTVTIIVSHLMSPRFDTHYSQPGSGHNITLTHGIFTRSVLKKIFNFWPKAFELISQIELIHIKEIFDTIYAWAFPYRIVATVNNEIEIYMQKCAKEMLSDMLQLAENHPALQRIIVNFLNELKENPKVEIDLIYDTLFPNENTYLDRAKNKKPHHKVRILAETWKEKSPIEVIKRIKWAEKEASLVERSWPCLISSLCMNLAEIVHNPIEWGMAFFEARLSPDYIGPFFEVSINKSISGWDTFANKLIATKEYFPIVYNAIFCLEIPSEDILQKCLLKLTDIDVNRIKTLFIRKGVSIFVAKKLLTHSNPKIAFFSAIGEWQADPYKQVRDEIKSDWERVLKTTNEIDHNLKEIFLSHPDLAYSWLLNLSMDYKTYFHHEIEQLIFEAIQILNFDQKKGIIDKYIAFDRWSGEVLNIIKWIIGDCLDLYEYLIKRSSKRTTDLILAPLATFPNEDNWGAKALLALKNGLSMEQIINSCLQKNFGIGFWGPISNQYKSFIEPFNELSESDNENIKKLAKLGLNTAQKLMNKSLKEEREREIFGYDEMW